jgi:ribosomal protein L32
VAIAVSGCVRIRKIFRSYHGSPTKQEVAVEARHAPLAVEPSTGEVHLRHHISPNGYYRGKKVVKTKND